MDKSADRMGRKKTLQFGASGPYSKCPGFCWITRQGREKTMRINSNTRGGFTLVEIMIVVVIIGLLAAVAIPAFQKVQQRSRATRFANDFRQFEAAYQRFFMEGNPRPPVTGGGITPPGMSGYLPASYNETSVMGGSYWWSGPSGAIVLLGSTANDAIMVQVDVILDDGVLTTGIFQKIGGGYGVLVR